MVARPLVLGHRGASAYERENTIAAFVRARALGADGVELDARRTSDDVLVVHHDPAVDELGLLMDVSFASLRAQQPDIPTLHEALDACTDMIVNVEVKCLPWEPDSDVANRRVLHAVLDEVRDRDQIVLSSFDLDAVDLAHTLMPELKTAWLTSRQPLADASALAAARGHWGIHPDKAAALDASREVFDAAHANGLHINVWTVDDPADARRLYELGADGIVTNVPDVVLAVVREPRS
jgi:glycerophosphoryl diester phosphodiesterase